MKKNKLKKVLIAGLVGLMAFGGFTGCSHEVEFETAWSSDEKYHWHQPSEEDLYYYRGRYEYKSLLGYGEHEFVKDKTNRHCSVCGYTADFSYSDKYELLSDTILKYEFLDSSCVKQVYFISKDRTKDIRVSDRTIYTRVDSRYNGVEETMEYDGSFSRKLRTDPSVTFLEKYMVINDYDTKSFSIAAVDHYTDEFITWLDFHYSDDMSDVSVEYLNEYGRENGRGTIYFNNIYFVNRNTNEKYYLYKYGDIADYLPDSKKDKDNASLDITQIEGKNWYHNSKNYGTLKFNDGEIVFVPDVGSVTAKGTYVVADGYLKIMATVNGYDIEDLFKVQVKDDKLVLSQKDGNMSSTLVWFVTDTSTDVEFELR